jgi:peptidoglycan/LPS O-acetylase OafA/YrhL
MFLVQFGIPIFFFISGNVATLFDAERPNGFRRYLWSKFMRLFVPLIVSIFLFLIPRHYIGQSWDPIGLVNGQENWDFATYVPSLLADDFLTKLGPLWFLPAIFIIVIINYPMIRYSKRRAELKPWNIEDTKLVIGQLALILIAWNFWCKGLTEPD